MKERIDRKILTDLKERKHPCTAVLLAAGQGLRMGGDTRKQYLDLKGRPLFTYALEAMDRSEIITDIVITVPAGDESFCGEIVSACGLGNKVRRIIAGGSERCFSVHIGLQAVDWPCDYAFIHDAARPFIDEAIIRRLYEEVRVHNACVAGVPSKDTVKIADSEGFVKNTPNRKDVWIVQTPQVFAFTLIKEAYEKMAASYDELCAKGVIITDDAMVVEFMTGARVRLVEASYSNIKVTTPEDMGTVLSYLRGK